MHEFDPLIGEIPDLKEILVDPARVDRDALRAALDHLARQHRRFEDAVAAAGRHVDLGLVLGAEGKESTLSTAEFAGWLQAESSRLLTYWTKTTRQ